MLKESRKPYGYKDLLVYQKAEELQRNCSALTHLFPRLKTLIALADQMDRSARSVKQNIVEGWKRNSTKEYYEFLGFSIGANAELEEDCLDICKGVYPELMGIRGVMGRIEERGSPSSPSTLSTSHSTRSIPFSSPYTHFAPSSNPKSISPSVHSSLSKPPSASFSSPSILSTPHSSPSAPFSLSDIEKLPFYPLNPSLPPVIQLKLRCKELNFLLVKLQKSLEEKMTEENTLSTADRFKKSQIHQHKGNQWYEKILAKQGFARLPNGKVVKNGQKQ